MIGTLILVLGFLFIVGHFTISRKWANYNIEYEGYNGHWNIAARISETFLWIGIASITIFGIAAISTYLNQVGDTARFNEREARIINAEQRQDDIEQILVRELSNYPEFEKEAYEAFLEEGDTSILLTYPELQSNIVVTNIAERYTDTVDIIYDERQDLEATYRRILFRESNQLAPKIGFPWFDHDRKS